jgi:hypothetical protein
MTLRRSSRRRRARRATSSALRTIRSIALVRALLAAVRRRRALALAVRGGPAAIAVAVVLALLARRRRRARLEAELGPPNQSAPGHQVAPSAPLAVPGDPDAAEAPNQGAAGAAVEPAPTA